MKKTKNYHAGWDYFSPDPGEYEKMFCRVCNTEMNVKRNVMGPTGWAEAMSVHAGSSKGHLHDCFSCPNAGKKWHNQARILKDRIQREASQSIAEILQKEVTFILTFKKTTRKRGSWEYL